MTVEFDCESCGIHVITYRSPSRRSAPRFCSQSCHGAAVRGTGAGPRPNHVVTCEFCGRVDRVYRSPMVDPPRFCSLACLGASQRGEHNPAFNGGRHKLANGYFVVLAPDDPEADSRGYVYEHRLVARIVVGRMLRDGEVVHHGDGNKTNNAQDNIGVFSSQSAHLRHHRTLERARR